MEVAPFIESRKFQRTDAPLESPEPGSLWIAEQSHLRWLYIAQEGHRAIKITIRKETGKVMAVDLEGYINGECRKLKIESIAAPTPEDKAAQ